MVFWRKKNNPASQDAEERADRIIHHPDEPALEPSTEHESDIDPDLKHRLQKTELEILEDLEEVPQYLHTPLSAAEESDDLGDHSDEGGWLSRLTKGLSKSSAKIGKGFSDLLTKRKLDREALDRLEEILIEADLGPKTAAKVVEEFSKDRFGKDMEEGEIRAALAKVMEKILDPLARELDFSKPVDGPFVLLVCGVNGAGKTTTIGKLAYQLHFQQKKKVMIAAGDTFRAAAVEQLEEWARRAGASFVSKDVGADAAALSFEAYREAQAQNADVLMIDTAGRLQNKANLMEELKKIIRVLKKQNENLPHAVVLVLDSTTGQNAFSQVEAFLKMIDITGIIVTKLDGSAKGGVLVGLADRFGLPVHAVGVGERIRDLQPFHAGDYARSLMGL